MSHVSRAAVAAVVLGVVAPLTTAVPAHAATQFVIDDATGDVEVSSDDSGLSDADLQSIDIVRVRAYTAKGGGTRFVVRLPAVKPGADFDQVVAVTASRADGATFPIFSAGWSPQQRDQPYASLQRSDEDVVDCTPPRTSFDADNDVILQYVPQRCLPRGRMKVVVRTYAGIYQSDAIYSSDVLRFTHRLR